MNFGDEIPLLVGNGTFPEICPDEFSLVRILFIPIMVLGEMILEVP